MKLISASEGKAIDDDLMSVHGFSLDQLMELAGLSVAASICKLYPPLTHPRVLVLAGPGNNGGDGMVAARHLKHFGYEVVVCYPRQGRNELYQRLRIQLNALAIPIFKTVGEATAAGQPDVVVDSLFGFSFDSSADIREPFPAVIKHLVRMQADMPTVAVDVPSSWDVEYGDVKKLGVMPETLISLTAPKLCARHWQGKHHAIGGRFVPPGIVEKYSLRLPTYQGSDQFVVLSPSL